MSFSDVAARVGMPVSDQWKAREKAVGGRVEIDARGSQSEAKSPAQVEGQGGSTADGAGPLSPGRTKGLAGFWATQNDEVKVSRKKRLEAVETPATETVAENVPRRLDGLARAEDPGEWKKPVEMEAGRTQNVANVFQQQQQHTAAVVPRTQGRADAARDGEVTRRPKPPAVHTVSDTTALKRPAQSPDVVLNRSSATVVLAENDPAQLNPDVVRSSGGSSWDDVTELEAGRTRNLLQHWKSTEEDAAQPKTSTTRYQGGAKPAWILEIEEARATSTGAIGQSEAWAGNLRQQPQQQQQEQQDEQQDKQQEMQEEERKQEEREKDDVEEKVEEKEEEEVRSDDGPVEQVHSLSTTAAEHLSNEPVTSQQQPASDVIHDLRDVSSAPPSQPRNEQEEHVTVLRHQQLETPSTGASVIEPSTLESQLSGSPAERDVDEEMTPGRPTAAELAVSTRLHAAEDFQICEESDAANDEVNTRQELATADHSSDRCVLEQPRGHDQQPPTSSASSAAATDAVARQQTVPPSSSTSTTVEAADQHRSKKRHKEDKSKRTDHSAEHHHRRWCLVM